MGGGRLRRPGEPPSSEVREGLVEDVHDVVVEDKVREGLEWQQDAALMCAPRKRGEARAVWAARGAQTKPWSLAAAASLLAEERGLLRRRSRSLNLQIPKNLKRCHRE